MMIPVMWYHTLILLLYGILLALPLTLPVTALIILVIDFITTQTLYYDGRYDNIPCIVVQYNYILHYCTASYIASILYIIS